MSSTTVLLGVLSALLLASEGREYKIGTKSGIDAARQYCLDTYGTTLATITSPQDSANAIQAMADGEATWAWIGLNDLDTHGTWAWEDGADCSYAPSNNCRNDPFWGPNEPGYDSDSCVYMGNNGRYNNVNCGPGGEPWTLCNYPITEGVDYTMVSLQKTWAEAQDYCVNVLGTQLASIHSQTQNDEAYQLCADDRPSTDHNVFVGCYVGFSSDANEDWTWSDATNTDFGPNWRDGAPNNVGGNHCAFIKVNLQDTQWEDTKCDGDPKLPRFLCNSNNCVGVDCSNNDACTSGVCNPETETCEYTAISCDDSDLCTVDSCDPLSGCVFEDKCASNKVCEAATGDCKRDCNAFIIDDFLRDCSAEFDGNEAEIATLQTKVSDLEMDLADGGATEGRLDGIEADIAANDVEISAIQGELAGPINVRFNDLEGNVEGISDGIAGAIEDRFVAIETEISGVGGIDSRLDALDAATQPGGAVEVRFEDIEAELSKFTARSHTGKVIGGVEKTSQLLWISAELKDKLFMFLLIMDTVLVIAFVITCVLLNKSRSSTKYQYSEAQFSSSETDDENQQLQR